MTTQAFILLDAQQKADAEALNDTPGSGGVAVEAREIENPLSNNLGLGTLVGLFVIPARILNDPLYVRWVPSLGALPIHVMDSDTLFAPVPEEV